MLTIYTNISTGMSHKAANLIKLNAIIVLGDGEAEAESHCIDQ